MTAIANDNFFGENWKYLLAALAMHVALVAALTVTFNSTRQPVIASQLAIKAVVIDNTAKRLKREKEQAEAERAAREQAEADEKAREQLAEEKKREQEAETKRQADQQKVAAEQKRKSDAQQATLRKQADDKKRADAIKTQQTAKQKADREAREEAQLAAQREREMAEEAAQMAVESSSMSSAYYASIVQRIESNWIKPPTATRGLECNITLTQAPGGLVVSMAFGKCNGDKAVRESLETAVYNAAPLPAPPDARLFKRQITFLFKPSN